MVRRIRRDGGRHPQKSARPFWPEEACRWAAGNRQIIEGVICQLKDQFSWSDTEPRHSAAC